MVAVAGEHQTQTNVGTPSIELWQVINLTGAPLLVLLFAGPVIEDLKSWWAARQMTRDRGTNR